MVHRVVTLTKKAESESKALSIHYLAGDFLSLLATEGQLSNEKRAPDWLGYIGDEILPRFIGIIINHDKDPYKPTNIMESNKGFFRGSTVLFV